MSITQVGGHYYDHSQLNGQDASRLGLMRATYKKLNKECEELVHIVACFLIAEWEAYTLLRWGGCPSCVSLKVAIRFFPGVWFQIQQM